MSDLEIDTLATKLGFETSLFPLQIHHRLGEHLADLSAEFGGAVVVPVFVFIRLTQDYSVEYPTCPT